jgi:hypothetical protein
MLCALLDGGEALLFCFFFQERIFFEVSRREELIIWGRDQIGVSGRRQTPRMCLNALIFLCILQPNNSY